MKTLFLVGLGGGIGSILRYLASVLTSKLLHSGYPAGTFIVNILGCFIAGCLIAFLEQRQVVDSHWKFLFITGFCGGFTTFSAFSVETMHLFESGQVFLGIGYVAASILLGLCAVWLGLALVRN